MLGLRLRPDRPLTACFIAILATAALTAASVSRQGGGSLKGIGSIPKSQPVTVDISIPPVGVKTSEHARTYKVDVWFAAEPATARSVFPIVYVSGWGGSRSDNKGLLTALANAGYVVLAVDDITMEAPYDDPLDEAARTAPFDLSTEAATRSFISAGHRRTALQTEKVLRLLDKLAAEPLALPQLASIGIRFDRVGVLGYSFGGATAAQAGKQDARVVAAVNLDGWHFGSGADQIAAFPYLLINSIEARLDPQAERLADSQARNEALLNAAEDARQIRQATARQDTYRMYLRGARHGDLSDAVGAWRRVLTRLKSGGALIAPAHARRALDTAIVAFFDMHVRQSQNVALAKILAAEPNLVALGSQPFH